MTPRAALRVIDPGTLSTIQDLGRPGHAHLAVPVSGAADRPSLVCANRRIGNPDDAAGIEMTLVGAGFEVLAPLRLAVAGADMPVRLGNRVLPHDTAFDAQPGDRLIFGASTRGLRGYLGIAGGVDAEPVLGSRATDLLTGLGPAVLSAGQVLSCAAAPVRTATAVVAEPAAVIGDSACLPFLPGPRDDRFDAAALDALCRSPWRVSRHSNRVAVRLQGVPLVRRDQTEQPSEALVPGAIQVPPSGQPLVFLYDHPTTGGYPVIGVVMPGALAALAQARPGGTLRFSRADRLE